MAVSFLRVLLWRLVGHFFCCPQGRLNENKHGHIDRRLLLFRCFAVFGKRRRNLRARRESAEKSRKTRPPALSTRNTDTDLHESTREQYNTRNNTAAVGWCSWEESASHNTKIKCEFALRQGNPRWLLNIHTYAYIYRPFCVQSLWRIQELPTWKTSTRPRATTSWGARNIFGVSQEEQ